ncbi:alpha/beta hydrolase [Polyangium mundeleinium]|uniref:Alpha/beta hydrolase n=1 Tax=Polyangium mundeleinium TaxID=2995306 RepID=A0ABT5EM60_9BACT|nr:alpha/beta hydrolase [Polyangium mundeleinium]MDC0742937.1 alpha/beta hydrolase [Polyangium mundeleinium]
MGDCKVIPLWRGRKSGLPTWGPTMEVHRADRPRATPGPAVVIFPGGGYQVNAPSESLPVVRWLCDAGFHAVLAFYRVAPCAYPAAVADAMRAVRLTRHHAAELGIDPERIGMVGFSAGGHLAGLVSFAPHLMADPDDDLAATISPRPQRLALVYPVGSFLPPTHEGSVARFCGVDSPDADLRARFSLERLVDRDAPPVLIAHAADDLTVPLTSSLTLARAYRENNVDVSAHVFPRGGHGFVLEPPDAGAAWPDPLRLWFEQL